MNKSYTIICRICGGSIVYTSGMSVMECLYCGNEITLPDLENETRNKLFTRADQLLYHCEFERAGAVYASITDEYPQDAEAHWRQVLAAYGIQYVEDPETAALIPTCHRSRYTSILKDKNYLDAIKYADEKSRAVYIREAHQLEKIRTQIITYAATLKKYQAFICYKENDPYDRRTEDSRMAQKLYEELTRRGVSVFWAPISLKEYVGEQYEPYIFAALHSADRMFLLASSMAYIDSPWVANEWQRYLEGCTSSQKQLILCALPGLSASDLPSALADQECYPLSNEEDIVVLAELLTPGLEDEQEAFLRDDYAREVLRTTHMYIAAENWQQANERLVRLRDEMYADCSQEIFGEVYRQLFLCWCRCTDMDKCCERYPLSYLLLSHDCELWKKYAPESFAAWYAAMQEKNHFWEQELTPLMEKARENQKLFGAEYDWRTSRPGDYSYYGVKVDPAYGTIITRPNGLFPEAEAWKDVAGVQYKNGTCWILTLDGGTRMTGYIKYPAQVKAIESWRNLKDLYILDMWAVGVHRDGTVISTDQEGYQLPLSSEWHDIISVCRTNEVLYGVRSDGVLVSYPPGHEDIQPMNSASGLFAVAACDGTVAGLRRDGTVWVWDKSKAWHEKTDAWTDIISIAVGDGFVAGLTRNSKVIVAGSLETVPELAKEEHIKAILSVYKGLAYTATAQVNAVGPGFVSVAMYDDLLKRGEILLGV